MANKSNLFFKPYLFVLIHGGSGNPYAMRLNVRKLTTVTLLVATTFFVACLGTLLFFRELEMNRKLQDRLLEVESREKMTVTQSTIPRSVSTTTAPVAPLNPVAASANSLPTLPKSAGGLTNARVNEVTAECVRERCDVRMSMVPARTGIAEGELLMVLETEIPRIGSANPTTTVRKRYYVYPGSGAKDELTQEGLVALERKPFKFTKALQTNATFTMGKLLRPLAINVYIFDKQKSLVHHERKVIDNEE